MSPKQPKQKLKIYIRPTNRANQWTGFYMITASVIKELNKIEVGEKKVLKAKSLLSKVSKVQ